MNPVSTLDTLFASVPHISLSSCPKIVLMSDCHRGSGDWADDFAHNELIFLAALKWYYKAGYTYIELGDGDELWENRKLSSIYAAHPDVFHMLKDFTVDGRYHRIVGNHDRGINFSVLPYKPLLPHPRQPDVLFPDASTYTHDALVLDLHQYGSTSHILLAHGHQVDFIAGHLYPANALIVRYLWRHLQILGIKDPTRPATNSNRRNYIESSLVRWVQSTRHTLISGHTHLPRFGSPHPRYFNTGSCVHPNCITAIEIADNKIALFTWQYHVDDDQHVKIARKLVYMPRSLSR